jgi:hypothetical protein
MLEKDENKRSSSKQLMDKIQEKPKFIFEKVKKKNQSYYLTVNKTNQFFIFSYLMMKFLTEII